MCVIVRDLETPTMRRPMRKLGCCVREKILNVLVPDRDGIQGREGEVLHILNPRLHADRGSGYTMATFLQRK